MNNKRLQEIKDSVNFQKEILLAHNLETLCVDEEQELIEEIERLNKLICQREKKWEKWTTEKTILSTKMSDYLCKYQNIKREYTKQIKISTDRKKEIERLNNIINELDNWLGKKILSWKDDGNVSDNIYHERLAIQMIYFKLQELKGEYKE